MSVCESADIVDEISAVEREDSSPQQSSCNGSVSTKDDRLLSFLSDMREDMQLTHKLLAQMLAQGNTSSSQGDENFGGKRKAKMFEVAVPSHVNANKRSKNTHTASEKATKHASEKATDNASEKAQELASNDEVHDQTPDESNIVEDDILSVHAGVDELIDQAELDSDENEEVEDLLAVINESLNPSDETGAPVSERLAKLVNEKFTLDFDLEKRKSIMENYKTPKNCDQLFSPRVNPEIWGRLSSSVKRTDIKSSVLQDILLSVSSAMVNTMEALLESRGKKAFPNYEALLSNLTDSIALLGHVHKEISFNRKDALRYHLNPEFRQACSRVVKPTRFLFGDDLSKTIQDIRATNKVVNTVAQGTFSNRGQLSSYYSEWANFTSDSSILETVSGEKLNFIEFPIASSYPLNSICKEHYSLADAEIKSLLEKRVIIECSHEEGEFISPVFTVPKKDGRVRLILNLKKLNQCIQNYHFKMEGIQTIMKLVTKNCWMATLDLKDAYYSVKVDPAYQKYLKFFYRNKLYKYLALPNGLATCPRKFTKLMKPPLAQLRERHHIISGYIDDFYLQGHTYARCANNILDTVETFDRLGLVIHPEKSVTSPSQEVIILGFVINSITMTIRVTIEKKEKIKKLLIAAIANPVDISIRQVAKIIGCLVSSLPGVQYGALYYRYLEMDKISALKIAKGNFDAPMTISEDGLVELRWWVTHIDESFNYLMSFPIDITIYSDASLQGWGAVLGDTSSGGRWSPEERTNHINYLELLAAFFALRLFCNTIQRKHVKLMIDYHSSSSN
ncbi:uncharacterized protein LOC114538507 [Dendronephthya gigantea]|uniref:uncharacterized protein LOC114538507 n=1 Tax=Dendronephthya gigantea TaxID=151771 RepID=UPI001069C19B|nr:uncharacterized protein LOC114538507 [Dendronephthya gigantea]